MIILKEKKNYYGEARFSECRKQTLAEIRKHLRVRLSNIHINTLPISDSS